MAKKREVDFSLNEMLELTGLTRKQFRDALLRFCDMYNFNLVDFKVDETNEKSDYFFPPEIAEPLGLMLKHIINHPLYRKNTDPTTVTATALADYNAGILKDVDESVPVYFNNVIYSLPGHLVAQEISDWSALFVRELTHFMVNLSSMENENIGATMKDFTRKLSKMNYYLYRGNYSMKRQDERNKQIEKELYNIDEDSEIDIRLQKQNLSIDRVLAELIRWEMEGAHHMREEGFPDLKEILDYENNRRRILGVKFQIMDKNDQVLFEDIPNPTIEQQRGGYYSFVLGQTLDIARFKINKSNSEKMKEYRKKWKAIDTQIEDGTFNESTVREEYRKAIMEEMEKIDERRKGLQEELDSVDGKEGAPFAFETDDDLKESQASYVDYCKKVDISEKSLYDIVNHFVGQAMYEFLK